MIGRVTGAFLVVIVMIVLPASAVGEINENAGTRAMTFLKIGVGGEAIGMGESVTSLSGDVFSAYWNPAGLNYVQRNQIALMHGEWLEDVNHEFVGYAHPIGSTAALAVTANYLSYGQLDRRNAQGDLMGTFRPYDLAIGLSAATRLSQGVFLGATGKWVSERIDQESASAVAGDFGLIYNLPRSLVSVGIVVQNLGTKVKFSQEEFSLPTTIAAGIAYRVAGGNVAFSADLRKPADDSLTIGAGIGVRVMKILQLRCGYRYETGGNDLGALSGLRLGFGFGVDAYQIDYAFVNYGELGLTHRVSLSAGF